MRSARLLLALGATTVGLACNELIGLSEGDALPASDSSSAVGSSSGSSSATVGSSSSASSSSSSSSSGSSSSSSSSGGNPMGCSDGTRESYQDLKKSPGIAGCAGGFTVPGLLSPIAPSCGRKSGNSSNNPQGKGCSAEDLCAVGWHVCTSSMEVSALGGACDDRPGFWAAAQGVEYNSHLCGPTYHNDVAGCGTLGGSTVASCAPLTRLLSLNQGCGDPWDCGADSMNELVNVRKLSDAGGGVLCCSD